MVEAQIWDLYPAALQSTGERKGGGDRLIPWRWSWWRVEGDEITQPTPRHGIETLPAPRKPDPTKMRRRHDTNEEISLVPVLLNTTPINRSRRRRRWKGPIGSVADGGEEEGGGGGDEGRGERRRRAGGGGDGAGRGRLGRGGHREGDGRQNGGNGEGLRSDSGHCLLRRAVVWRRGDGSRRLMRCCAE